MATNESVNPTNFGIEEGYPDRIQLADELISWDVRVPDSVDYGKPVTNLSPQRGTVVQKLRRLDLPVSSEAEITELSRMSMLDVVTAKGPDFAAALMNVRFPLGRTGLNGVGIFYEAGASSTSDMIVVHQHERGIEVPLVFTRNRWNTPGGFAEAGETPETTALREFAEETGHHLDIDEPTLVIHEVKQSDRSTDHGWLEANVFAVRTDTRFAVSIGENADDAKDVRWWNVSALPTLVSLGELSTQKLRYIEQSIRVLEQE